MYATEPSPRLPVDPTAFDRSSLTVYLKDVVTLVLENRPADPIGFIADYLRRVLSGASSVSRAYQYLTLSPHHRQAFMDNAVVAFSVLDAGERDGVAGKRAAGGTGDGPALASFSLFFFFFFFFPPFVESRFRFKYLSIKRFIHLM